MIEKALIILLFMYISSFGLLGVQYSVADVFGITMVDINGNAIKSDLLVLINVDQLNQISTDITDFNETETVENPATAGAQVAWEIFTLLTGTYIFNVLIFFGVPTVFIVGMVIVYLILVWRALIAYIRGV